MPRKKANHIKSITVFGLESQSHPVVFNVVRGYLVLRRRQTPRNITDVIRHAAEGSSEGCEHSTQPTSDAPASSHTVNASEEETSEEHGDSTRQDMDCLYFDLDGPDDDEFSCAPATKSQ